MNARHPKREQASVLMMSLITITILTLICATSLYVLSQNANATTQTTSWQQSMAGAEAAVDMAMKALNSNSWTGWSTVTSTTLPTGQPSGGSTATGVPGSGNYNYYTTSFTLIGEGSNSLQMWVTIDNGSVAPTPSPSPGLLSNGRQAYRIRAAGAMGAPGPARVANNKLDNDLRKISLRWDRFASGGSGAVTTPQAVRRIELIAQPIPRDNWGLAVALRGAFNMSGSGIIDSFDSRNNQASTNGQYDPLLLHLPPNNYGGNASIGQLNSNGSDLRSTDVYGSLTYSGTQAPRNTNNVHGVVSTPYGGSIADVSSPSWTTGYSSYAGAGMPATLVADGTQNSPTLIKINGDVNLSGGQSLSINPGTGGTSGTKYVTIWVTGNYTTSGSAFVSQASGVNVTWYVGGDMTTSGESYNNASGSASAVSFNAYGPTGSKMTISGSGNFVGTINAPNYNTTLSGSGSLVGALITNTLDVSGQAGIHYDEALGSNPLVANYSYASWFEDNADPARGIIY